MRLTIFTPTDDASARPRVGLLADDGVRPLDLPDAPTAGAALKRLIADFDVVGPQLDARAADALALDRVRLLPPLADPAKILCTLRMPMQHTDTEDALHVFLKAAGSTVGDGAEVVLPRLPGAALFTHDGCLAAVIGRTCRGVGAADWRDVVFGFTALVDVAGRTDARERWKDGLSALGSSCDTFGPLGPAIVPRETVERAGVVELELRCAGELRQRTRFDDLDDQVGAAIERATSIMTLHPGDVVAVGGAPTDQGPLQDGDELRVDLTAVGRLSATVRDPAGRRWDRAIRVAAPAA